MKGLFYTHELERIMVNPQAFHEAADRYGDMVYRIALNQARSAADAEDICQSVFLKLYVRGPKSASSEHLKRWLIRVTVNECNSLWRTPWRKRTELRGVDGEEIASMRGREADYVGTEFLDYDELYEALAKLSEKTRIVVHLFYFEGYSTPEIASILRMREATVRTRLSRARAQLKDLLEGDESDEC